MTPFQISAIEVILTACLRVLSCNELYDLNMVKDIQNHFQTNWIIIQTCRKTDYPIIKLAKDIKKSMDVYTTIFEWEDFPKVKGFGLQGTFRPLVLLSCWLCSLNCLTPMNEMQQLIIKFKWILLKHENTAFNLSDINIPINGIFMLVERSAPGLFTIYEVYRISMDTNLIYDQNGIWSSHHGLNYTTISWEERRSNFFGCNITTLMEREDSENPLKEIFDHFAPYYFDLGKRLNFTVDKTTDPKKYHEISIIMDWEDAPSEKDPFQPLYGSRQSIFFKDIGVGIQLNGYITPFQTAVWEAAILIVILAAVLSYIAANFYTGMTREKKISRRIEFYMYKSFYILCQRSEMDETYAAHRIITLSQWIVSIFLFSCYSAIFISFISVEIPKPPFTTLDELLQKKGYNIVTSKYISSNTLGILQNSGDPKLRKLYTTHFDPTKNLVINMPDAFCQNKYFIIITSDVHMTVMKSTPKYFSCKTSKKNIRLNLRHLTWFIEKNSHYKRIIQVYISKILMSGLMQDLLVKRRTFINQPQTSDFRGITLEDTTMLFIIIATGLVLSISIFCVEIVYKKLKDRV